MKRFAALLVATGSVMIVSQVASAQTYPPAESTTTAAYPPAEVTTTTEAAVTTTTEAAATTTTTLPVPTEGTALPATGGEMATRLGIIFVAAGIGMFAVTQRRRRNIADA